MAASLSGRLPAPSRGLAAPSRNPILRLALALLLAALVLAPRLAATDVFVTTDELFWLGRAGGFARGLSQGRLDSTFQSGHPGVTTMWTAVASLGIHRAEAFAGARREISRREVSENPDFVPALAQARRGVALVTGVATLLLVGLAWRLFGPLSALLAGGLLAFEPFLLAHSRLLHIDAELASFTALAVVSALTVWLRRAPLALMILAGVATGLALVSKAPALILLGFIPLIGAWIVGLRSLRQVRFWGALLLWGVAAVVTYVAAWPAMWTSPLGTLDLVLAFMRDNANPPRLTDAASERAALGPGFYWLTWLLRSSPLTIAGVLLALVAAFTLKAPERSRWRTATLVLIAFAALFGLFMAFAAKNFDRYLLPAFPVLGLVAGFGWAAVARGLALRAPRLLGVMTAALVTIQAALALHTAPYYVSYFNPLAGPAERSASLVASGWGEGLDQVARYLDSQPNPDRLKVGLPGEIYTTVLGAQTRAQVAPAEGADASAYDYLVVYSRNIQLDELPPFFVDQTHGWQPELAVELNGVFYAWLYNTRHGAPLGADQGASQAVVGYGLSDASPRPGQRIEVTLYWNGTPPEATPDFAITRDGQTPIGLQAGTPRAIPDRAATRTPLTVPDTTPLGTYTLLVRPAPIAGASPSAHWLPLRTIDLRSSQR